MDGSKPKWDLCYVDRDVLEGEGARVLQENIHLLPFHGKALDLACGLGSNALKLARAGLETTAWDISETAIAKLKAYIEETNLPLIAEARDVVTNPPERHSFDVIVVSRFLCRSLAPKLVSALKPDGLLFYQTFIRDVVTERGPRNVDYRLKFNELLSLFSSLKVLVYREEARVGNTNRGFRDEAMFIGLKS